jgi:6,7-dimethyl-8-ribityllumazine synthase
MTMAGAGARRSTPRLDPAPHLMLVEARYYERIADEMMRGALRAIEEAGATHERFVVPGAFEIPAAVYLGMRSGQGETARRAFDGFVALGCVIRGETTHYDYVCGESARGLQELAMRHGLAIGYGILTVENEAQAWARAALDRLDKGGEATRACIEMIALRRRLGLAAP